MHRAARQGRVEISGSYRARVVGDAGDARPGFLIYLRLASGSQPKERRETGKRAGANVFWADGRWHGQRLPPITMR
jgi:hypothetical protein